MAKTVAPLLSFDAGGQIAKTQVYSRWKGRPYVRRYVVPANPDTVEQQKTRTSFKWLMEAWKFLPASATQGWLLYGDSLQITDRNAWAKANVSALRAASTLDPMTISPAARSGIIASAMVVTPGSGQLTVDLTAPVLPNGWSIASAYALAIPQQNPQTEANYAMVAGTDPSSAYNIVLAGLTPTEPYLVGGWFEYDKPDGTKAYGQSLQDVATPTA